MRVMIVDDDVSVSATLREVLKVKGYKVEYYTDSVIALEDFKKNPADVVLVDLHMPKMDGFQLMNALKDVDSEVDIVVITGYGTMNAAINAMKAGAYDFITKPFKAVDIETVLERIVQRKVLLKTLTKTKDRIGELQEINRKLNVLNQMKDNFIGSISHELRTPLAILQSALSNFKLVDFERLGDKQKYLVKMMESALNRMMNVVESIIDISLTSSENLSFERFNLYNVVNNIVEQFDDEIRRKNLEVKLNCSSGLEIVSDRRVINRIFFHLISNAIKFNKENGSVWVDAQLQGDMLYIVVTDTGIGIPEDKKDQIFDSFFQVDGGTTRLYGGLGIGLTAVKRYLLMLNGEINVSSRIGDGSRFTLKIPVKGG